MLQSRGVSKARASTANGRWLLGFGVALSNAGLGTLGLVRNHIKESPDSIDGIGRYVPLKLDQHY